MRILLSLFFFAFILFFDCCIGANTIATDTMLQDSIRTNQTEQPLIVQKDSLPIKRIPTKEDSLLEAREDSLQKIQQSRMIGSANIRDTTNRLKFQKITAAEFAVFKKNYHNPIDTSIERVPHSKIGFSIKTADSLYNFKYDLNEFCYYNCYVKPLKLYMVYIGNGNNEIAWMKAIDSLNNSYYYIESPFDDGLMETRVSPGVKYILWFNNNWSGYRNSFISIVRISREGISYKYTDFLGNKSDEWIINDVVWINDTSFALKVYDEEGENNKLIGVRYLKASFK